VRAARDLLSDSRRFEDLLTAMPPTPLMPKEGDKK